MAARKKTTPAVGDGLNGAAVPSAQKYDPALDDNVVIRIWHHAPGAFRLSAEGFPIVLGPLDITVAAVLDGGEQLLVLRKIGPRRPEGPFTDDAKTMDAEDCFRMATFFQAAAGFLRDRKEEEMAASSGSTEGAG